MRRVFPTLTIVLALMTSTSGDQGITTATSDCYTRPQMAGTVNGKPQEPGIDLLCADIPEELSNQIKSLTGIVAKEDGISMIVVDLGKGRWMHNVAGSGFSAKGSAELPALGIKPWKHDFYVQYTSLVESVSGNEIYAYGYFDFNDKLNKKQCFVTVELRGEIIVLEGKKPKLQGTAKWTGPLQNVRFPAMEKKDQTTGGTKR